MRVDLAAVSKSFGAVQALREVSLTLVPGRAHALLGENGAGKSTLIKVLTGVHPPDAGELRLGGEPIQPGSPAAIRARAPPGCGASTGRACSAMRARCWRA